ncbi:DoxX family protein [Umezawaea tangerina]|uniref:Putative membrane protein n=1 Tax=Umezawaea tangerina TaxID=84725 RepID=A0A2T0TMI5_9PSEU|nr:MauE/DoxX family redox-associated membrane protein [Umezawaea tangerina]PRY46876.1 putative membrane protein [Umezawaea tangerina]
MASTRSRSRSALALAGLLGVAGVTHFAKPRPYDSIVPRVLPGEPRTWTYASGVAEIAVAAAVAVPRTRRLGGLLAAGLFAAVFPANVKMAIDYRDRGPRAKAIAWGRLPGQIPLIIWALRVRRSAA